MATTPPDDSNPDDLSETEALAMDYALGALERGDRLAVMLRLPGDPALAEAVARWQAVLAPLDEETLPVDPPPAVWDMIAAETVALPPRPVAAVVAPPPGWWYRANVWRGIAGGAVALAAGLAVLLIASPTSSPPVAPQPDAAQSPALVAVLADAGGRPLARLALAGGELRFAPVTAADDGRVAELWAIDGTSPPRSLGVIDPARAAVQGAGLKAGVTLAISLEPAGGSPTGAPTGPVIATGVLTPA